MRALAAVVLLATLAGCLADEPVQPAAAPPEGPLVDPVETEPEPLPVQIFEGLLAASVGTPVVAANPGADAKDFLFEFEVPANATSATVTMLWNATQPTSANLRLLVETSDEEATQLASADGPSPLVATFDATERAGATLRTRTFASASGGLAKDQPFALVVTYL